MLVYKYANTLNCFAIIPAATCFVVNKGNKPPSLKGEKTSSHILYSYCIIEVDFMNVIEEYIGIVSLESHYQYFECYLLCKWALKYYMPWYTYASLTTGAMDTNHGNNWMKVVLDFPLLPDPNLQPLTQDRSQSRGFTLCSYYRSSQLIHKDHFRLLDPCMFTTHLRPTGYPRKPVKNSFQIAFLQGKCLRKDLCGKWDPETQNCAQWRRNSTKLCQCSSVWGRSTFHSQFLLQY